MVSSPVCFSPSSSPPNKNQQKLQKKKREKVIQRNREKREITSSIKASNAITMAMYIERERRKEWSGSYSSSISKNFVKNGFLILCVYIFLLLI